MPNNLSRHCQSRQHVYCRPKHYYPVRYDTWSKRGPLLAARVVATTVTTQAFRVTTAAWNKFCEFLLAIDWPQISRGAESGFPKPLFTPSRLRFRGYDAVIAPRAPETCTRTAGFTSGFAAVLPFSGHNGGQRSRQTHPIVFSQATATIFSQADTSCTAAAAAAARTAADWRRL